MWATLRGHLEVVKLLVDAGASMDIQDYVSTRIRLFVQSNYNPCVHSNKKIKNDKYKYTRTYIYTCI